MSIDADTFRRAAGSFASGVTVITSAAGGRARGMTASAVCSLSLEPTLMLACVDKRAATLSLIRDSQAFVINVLSSEQRDLSGAFARKDLPRESLLEENTVFVGNSGVPVLRDCAAHFECRLVEEVDGGDHVILIGEVVQAGASADQSPLVYFRGLYGDFSPKQAYETPGSRQASVPASRVASSSSSSKS